MKTLMLKVVLAAVLLSTVQALDITATNTSGHVVKSHPQGSDVILNCSVTSDHGVDRLVWLKDDLPCTDNVTYEKDARGRILSASLLLENVIPRKLNGKYRCQSWQSNRTSSKTYQLRVDEPPQFLRIIRVAHVYIGDSVTLECKVLHGWPLPDIQWLSPTGKVSKTEKETNLSTRVFSDFKKSGDREDWVCKATNRLGVAKLRWYIFTEEREIFHHPEMTSQLNRTVEGNQGESVLLEVHTRYTPVSTTSYQWYFRGRKLLSNSKYDIPAMPQFTPPHKAVFRLIVRNLTQEDSGQYKLVVQTSIAPEAVDTLHLVVFSLRNVTTTATPPIKPGKTWIKWAVASSILFVIGIILLISWAKAFQRKRFKLLQGLDTSNEFPKFDLFISYTSSDFQWVSKHLIPLFEEHKLLYSIHSKDFEIGKTIVDNMADSVYMCKHVVAVVSDRYLESKFCRAELDMAIGRMHLAKDQRLTVIKLGAMSKNTIPRCCKANVYCQDIEKDEQWKKELMEHLLPLMNEKPVTQDTKL